MMSYKEIRKEAVMQALAMNKKQSMAPMPSKRTSAVYHPQPVQRREHTTGQQFLNSSVVLNISHLKKIYLYTSFAKRIFKISCSMITIQR